VLDLMIHDLDLVHQLIPFSIATLRAEGVCIRSDHADEVTARFTFANGARAELFASRAAEERKRTMRVIYRDGVVEIDFLARKMKNTTPREIRPLDLSDPLAESVAAFVAAARAGASALVRPEEARRAVETALLIEDAAERAEATARRRITA
jgi:predicted dehydrogenase